MDAPPIGSQSDLELTYYGRELSLRIDFLLSQLAAQTPIARAIKIFRATVLMTGGFLGSEVDLIAWVLTALGVWEAIESVEAAKWFNCAFQFNCRPREIC